MAKAESQVVVNLHLRSDKQRHHHHHDHRRRLATTRILENVTTKSLINESNGRLVDELSTTTMTTISLIAWVGQQKKNQFVDKTWWPLGDQAMTICRWADEQMSDHLVDQSVTKQAPEPSISSSHHLVAKHGHWETRNCYLLWSIVVVVVVLIISF